MGLAAIGPSSSEGLGNADVHSQAMKFNLQTVLSKPYR